MSFTLTLTDSLCIVFVLLFNLNIVLCQVSPRQWMDFDPTTNTKSIVQLEHARFSVLDAGVIRMEYSVSSSFVDYPTFTFINRHLTDDEVASSPFTVKQDGNTTTIQTALLTLSYDATDSATSSFNADNLKVTHANGYTWIPGNNYVGNLFGTFRTLDGNFGPVSLDCNYVNGENQHCNYSPLSTTGIAVIDDTHSPSFSSDAWPWPQSSVIQQPSQSTCQLINDTKKRQDCGFNDITENDCTAKGCCYSPALDNDSKLGGTPWCFYPINSDQDLYLFGFGNNFRGALKAYTRLAGQIPVPPRFAFGVWYSRYWAYSDIGYQNIVNEYEQHDVPLDVLVTDMDWHYTFYSQAAAGVKDQAGLEIGWTGFTFDPHLFPSSKSFLDWCKRRGLKNTLNVHPASGIQPWESTYSAMAEAMGIDPQSQKYVPFNVTDSMYVKNWFDIVLQPLEKQGIDFWWLDWQQGEQWITGPEYHGMNPTFLLNHYFFTSPSHFSDTSRPILFHRWGGLGNHRYQIGFSGDVVPSWSSLSFQPYFTSTAANVGYAFWSHDLGGHTSPSEPELYTRWLQWGAFSPIFRTHCTKNANNDRRIWTYPWAYYNTLRRFMKLRQSLTPYLYTQAHLTHATSVATVHPLYYDFPNDNRSYSYQNQYMFGDLLVQPIVAAVDATTGLAATTLFVPQGEWVNLFDGSHFVGPTEVKLNVALDEMPVYVPVNLILPLLPSSTPSLGSSQSLPLHLDLHLYPSPSFFTVGSGATASAHGSVTEDDGSTLDYLLSDAVSSMSFDASYNAAGTVHVDISPYAGSSFNGRPVARSYSVVIHNVLPATSVTLIAGGVSTALSREEYDESALTRGVYANANANTFMYDGATLTLTVLIRTRLDTSLAHALDVQLVANTQAGADADADATDVNDNNDAANADLLTGFAGKLQRFLNAKQTLDEQWGVVTVYQDEYPNLLFASECGSMISASSFSDPSGAGVIALLKQFTQWAQAAITELNALKMDDTVKAKLLAQLS